MHGSSAQLLQWEVCEKYGQGQQSPDCAHVNPPVLEPGEQVTHAARCGVGEGEGEELFWNMSDLTSNCPLLLSPGLLYSSLSHPLSAPSSFLH